MSRRELLVINLNKDLKETLKNTSISEWLFGSDLDNTIKSAKDLEKSGEQLKVQKNNVRVSTSKYQGNSRRPYLAKKGARQSGQDFRVSNQRRVYAQHYQQRPMRKQDRQQVEKKRRHP